MILSVTDLRLFECSSSSKMNCCILIFFMLIQSIIGISPSDWGRILSNRQSPSTYQYQPPPPPSRSVYDQGFDNWGSPPQSDQGFSNWRSPPQSDQGFGNWKSTSQSDQGYGNWRSTSQSDQGYGNWKSTSQSDYDKWPSVGGSSVGGSQSYPNYGRSSLSKSKSFQEPSNTIEVQGTKFVNGRTVPVTYIVNVVTGETTEKQTNSNPSPTLQKQRSFDDDFAAIKSGGSGTQVNFGRGAWSSTPTQLRFGTAGSTQTQSVSPSRAQSMKEDAAMKSLMDEYKNSEYGKFATAVANKELDIGGFEKLFGGFSGAGSADEASRTSEITTQPQFGTTQTQFKPRLGSTQTQPVWPLRSQTIKDDAAMKSKMDDYRKSDYGQIAFKKEPEVSDGPNVLGLMFGFGGGDESSRTSDYYKKVNEGGGIAALFGGDDAENAATDEADNKPPHTLLTIPKAIEIPLSEDKGDLFAPMMVGTPKDGSKPQVLRALLDTGSFHTWVVSSEYRGNHKCVKTDGQKSLTYSTKRIKAEQSFVVGSLKGFWSRDNIALGLRKKLPIPDQRYAEATEILDEDLLNKFDAIYGLSIVDKEVLPKEPSSNLANIAKHYGTVPKFGIFMNKDNKAGSKLVFAENHNYLIEGEFKSYPVQPNMPIKGQKYISGWHINFDGFSVQHKGKASQFIEPPDNTLAFPDSGTTTLTGPTKYVEQLYNAVFSVLDYKISGPEYEFDCSKMPYLVMTLPPINVVLGGVNYPIKAQDYLGKMGDTCKGFILGVDNCKDILLGRTFMSNYYTVYDYSNKLVHIGKALQPTMQPIKMM